MSLLFPIHADWHRSKFLIHCIAENVVFIQPSPLGIEFQVENHFSLVLLEMCCLSAFSITVDDTSVILIPDLLCVTCVCSQEHLGVSSLSPVFKKFHDDVPWYMFYFIHSAVHSVALFNLESSGKSHSMTLITFSLPFYSVLFSFFFFFLELLWVERWISWTDTLS